MQLTRTHYLIGGLVILILVVFAVVFGFGYKQPSPSGMGTTTTTGATTTTWVSSTTAVVSGPSGSYTITQMPAGSAPQAPSYKGTIACPTDFTASMCANMKSADATIIAKLDVKPTDFASWINLGMLRKQANDYQGAATAWVYVTKLYPTDPVAFNDLGDLYMNFLKDYPKADAAWKSAIKVQPNNPAPYADLYALYTQTSYKPSGGAAEAILKQGIAANPKAVNLQVDLARYYKSLGETAQANAEYDAAIENAQAQGQTQLASQITTEKAQ